MAPTRLCIIRHGETDWNAERRYQGHLDIELNQRGRHQAAAAAKGLAGHHFDVLYSSDLSRTRETAGILAGVLALPINVEPGLRERHYGLLQGRTAAEIELSHPVDFLCHQQRDIDHAFGNGESLKAFAARIVATLEKLLDRHQGESLLLVCHGGVLDVIYRHAQNMELSAPRQFVLPNAALNWLEVEAGVWRISHWADQGHLQTALDELPG